MTPKTLIYIQQAEAYIADALAANDDGYYLTDDEVDRFVSLDDVDDYPADQDSGAFIRG